jgi:hypothetical protein
MVAETIASSVGLQAFEGVRPLLLNYSNEKSLSGQTPFLQLVQKDSNFHLFIRNEVFCSVEL